MPGPVAGPNLTATDPSVMAAVQASAQGLQDVKGFGLSLLTNRWNRKYNEKMYNKQRQDALSDWQRAADYNSPQAQMARYREAGLNPNLIYGSATNSPMAQMKQAEMEKSSMPPYELKRSNIGEILGNIQNFKMIQQQIDNLQATNENIKAQTNYTNLKALTEQVRPGLVENQTLNEFWKYRLNARMDSHLNVMNPYIQKQAFHKIDEIIANINLKEGQASAIPGIIALNAQRVLQSKMQVAKNGQEITNLKEALKLVQSKTFSNNLENILRLQGSTYKDGPIWRGLKTGMKYTEHIDPAIDKVYKNIVPGWDNMKASDKMYYIMHESLNQ